MSEDSDMSSIRACSRQWDWQEGGKESHLHMPQLTHLDSDRNVAVLVSQVHVNDDGVHKQINIVRALQELMTSLVLLPMFA